MAATRRRGSRSELLARHAAFLSSTLRLFAVAFFYLVIFLADCFQSRMGRSFEGSCSRLDSSNTVLRGAAASSVCPLSGLFLLPTERRSSTSLRSTLPVPVAHTHNHGSAGKMTLQMELVTIASYPNENVIVV